MTGSEIFGIAARDLPPAVKRVLVWVGIGLVVGAWTVTSAASEQGQNKRLTAVEARQDSTSAALRPLVILNEYNACRGAQIDAGRDPSGCAFFLPPDLRVRLVPPDPR